jgi:outer membrane protein, multidrug efflux system
VTGLNRKHASALMLLALTAGCASLPTETASPDLSMAGASPGTPGSWTEPAVLPPAATSDPILDALLEEAVSSPDVAAAQARLAEARALLRAARAGLLPSLAVSASAQSTSGSGGSDGESTNSALSLAIPLDLFGADRARSGATASRERAARFELARARLLARRTAGQLYTQVRTGQEQILVARRSLASAEDSLSLAINRQRAGLETGLGVAQAASNRDALASSIPAFEQSVTAARLGLEALLGRQPGSLAAKLSSPGAIPWPTLDQQVPSPAAWLASRPDIAAQAALAEAAGLDSRAARADRFPELSLGVDLSDISGDVLTSGSATSTVLSIAATLFDFGRLDALAKAEGARAEAAAISYRKAVLDGLAEVETEASRARRADQTVAALAANVASASDQARLARVRYTSGLSSFLDVLVAERTLYAAESARTAAQGERASAAFAWRAALGL